jgi:hypothetical protein
MDIQGLIQALMMFGTVVQLVAGRLRRLLVEEHDLGALLGAMRALFLLGNGQVFQAFIDDNREIFLKVTRGYQAGVHGRGSIDPSGSCPHLAGSVPWAVARIIRLRLRLMKR